MSASASGFKAGYCAIIGVPNVGKSTLLNRFLGQKIAIVSPRPQTTRNRVLGVLTEPGYQLVFLDTPGIHRPKGPLGESMVKAAVEAVGEVDCVLLVVEPRRAPVERDTALVVEELRKRLYSKI